jgi:hypothetical protein
LHPRRLARHIPLELAELGQIDTRDTTPLALTLELTEVGWMPARPTRKAS